MPRHICTYSLALWFTMIGTSTLAAQQPAAPSEQRRSFFLSTYIDGDIPTSRYLLRNTGTTPTAYSLEAYDRTGAFLGYAVSPKALLEPGERLQITPGELPRGTTTVRVEATAAVIGETELVAPDGAVRGLVPALLDPSPHLDLWSSGAGDPRSDVIVLLNVGLTPLALVLYAKDSTGADLGNWTLPALAPMETRQLRTTELMPETLAAAVTAASVRGDSAFFAFTVSLGEATRTPVVVAGGQSGALLLPTEKRRSDGQEKRTPALEITTPLATSVATSSSCSETLPPPSDAGHADNVTCLIYDTGAQPNPLDITDGRIPLILIHGIHGRSGDGGFIDTNSTFDGWESLIAAFNYNYSLNSKYAIYRFSYDSDKWAVWDIAKSLRNWLDYFITAGKVPDTTFVIIAHSMGGLVARAYMQQHKHNAGIYAGHDGGERTVDLITLATPHHGSPGANDDSRQQMAANADQRDSGYPRAPGNDWSTTLKLANIAVELLDWWSGSSSQLSVPWTAPNRNDLLWDNFNSSMPNGAEYSSTTYLQALNAGSPYSSPPYDSRIIAYYGYLDLSSQAYQNAIQDVYSCGILCKGPGALITLASGNPLLASGILLNLGLAQPNPFKRPFIVNDGIVPLESGEYLGGAVARRAACPGSNHSQMQDGTGPVCDSGKSLFQWLSGDLTSIAQPNYHGALESADCSSISGWAWDSSHPEVPMKVEVSIDGTVLTTITASQFRSYLQTQFGGSGNHGFTVALPSSAKNGTAHSITAKISGTSFVLPASPKSVTCSAGSEVGYVDAAGNSTGGTTVAQGATLYVRGWAADTSSGAPVQSVTVFVDGNSKGTATLGGSRPDVATALNRSDFTNSGWNFQMAAASLSAGSHTVSATAVGPSGTGQLGSKTITVQAGGGSEIGYVDAAGDSTGATTLAQGGTLYVRGWAADTSSGAPVQSVTVFVDGNSKGTATLGGSRPDVATAFNRSDFTNSGWNFQMAAASLSAGSHTVSATAVGSSGSGQLLGSKTITIQAGGGSEIGYVDAASDSTGATTLAQGGTLYVRGWAADTASGAPVQSVAVFVDGSNKGTATLGGSRPDVATAFNRSDFTNSGWNFQTSTSSLSTGTHTVTATATGASGTSTLTLSKTISITAPVPTYDGYLDSATCSLIKGWVWDSTQPNTALQVDIYDGSTKIYSGVAANVFRQDLLNAGKGNGYHGFGFAPSGTLLNGGSHTLTAMVTGTSYTLKNTQTLSGCQAADFTFTTSNGSKSVQAGQQVGFDLSLTPVNNFTYPVTIFVSGLPASTSVLNSSLQFSIGPTSGASFTLSLQTTGSTPTGTYTLTLHAQGGGIDKYLYPTLTVTSPPPAPLSVSCFYSPNPITLGNGSTLFASATGGTGGYLYSLNGGSYQSGSSTTVLPSNGGSVTGSVTVKDSNNTTASNTCSLTVNGVAPSSITYYWDTQPIHGVPFSGYVYGNALTPSAEVWFYGPGCTSGCKQPAGVTWQSLKSLRVVSIQLGSGSYQVEVRTAYGSARSGSFTVN